MRNATSNWDACGMVPKGDTTHTLSIALYLFINGINPIFLKTDSKEPVEVRTEKELKDIKDGKAKKTPGGYSLVATDKKQIKKWYETAKKRLGGKEPNLGVGLDGKHTIVVDCDNHEATVKFAEMLDSWGMEPISHPTVLTPGVQSKDGVWEHKNGGHYYFTVPEGVDLSHLGTVNVGKDKELITFKISRGGVVIPPSKRPEGAYVWLGRVHDMNQAMVDFLLSRGKPGAKTSEEAPKLVGVVERSETDGEQSQAVLVGDDGKYDEPIDAWAESVTWDSLLTEAGWYNTGKSTCTSCHGIDYKAPGHHANDKSATAHEKGCGVNSGRLMVWTDNMPQCLADLGEIIGNDGKKSFTKLDFVAAYNHNGNRGAAMDALGISKLDKITEDEIPDSLDDIAKTSGKQLKPGRLLSIVPDKEPEPPMVIPDGHVRYPLNAKEEAEADAENWAYFDGIDGGRNNIITGTENDEFDGDTNYYVLLSDDELERFNDFVKLIEPYVTKRGEMDDVILAVAVRNGENPNDKKMYHDGAPYDPALVEQVFGYNDVTKAIFAANAGTEDDGHGYVSPFASLARELVRFSNRLPVGMKTWNNEPLSLFWVATGESGKGKSMSMQTQSLSPWPEQYSVNIKPADGVRVPELAGRDPDATVYPRSGQAIGSFLTHQEVLEEPTGETDSKDRPIMLTKKITVMDEFPSVVIEADELSALLAIASNDGSTVVSTLNSAYSNASLGGTRANGEDNHVDSKTDYRVSIMAGMQGSLFHKVLERAGDGFPQRLLMTLVTWPWAEMEWDFMEGAEPVPAPEVDVPVVGKVLASKHVKRRSNRSARSNAASSRALSEEEALYTHSMGTRRRIACIAAIMFNQCNADGTYYVDKKLWSWAGSVMRCSYRTYHWVKALVSEAKEREAYELGERRGRAKVAEDNTVADVTEQYLSEIRDAIDALTTTTNGGWVLKTDIVDSIGGSQNKRKSIRSLLSNIESTGNVGGVMGQRVRGQHKSLFGVVGAASSLAPSEQKPGEDKKPTVQGKEKVTSDTFNVPEV